MGGQNSRLTAVNDTVSVAAIIYFTAFLFAWTLGLFNASLNGLYLMVITVFMVYIAFTVYYWKFDQVSE